MNTYIYESDDGHGWVQVTIAELKKLGIAAEISRYSYRKGAYAWLEEDCDMTLFHHAKVAIGETPEYTERNVNGDSPVRGYARFCA